MLLGVFFTLSGFGLAISDAFLYYPADLLLWLALYAAAMFLAAMMLGLWQPEAQRLLATALMLPPLLLAGFLLLLSITQTGAPVWLPAGIALVVVVLARGGAWLGARTRERARASFTHSP